MCRGKPGIEVKQCSIEGGLSGVKWGVKAAVLKAKAAERRDSRESTEIAPSLNTPRELRRHCYDLCFQDSAFYNMC